MPGYTPDHPRRILPRKHNHMHHISSLALVPYLVYRGPCAGYQVPDPRSCVLSRLSPPTPYAGSRMPIHASQVRACFHSSALVRQLPHAHSRVSDPRLLLFTRFGPVAPTCPFTCLRSAPAFAHPLWSSGSHMPALRRICLHATDPRQYPAAHRLKQTQP
jgi:hypothetical protein